MRLKWRTVRGKATREEAGTGKVSGHHTGPIYFQIHYNLLKLLSTGEQNLILIDVTTQFCFATFKHLNYLKRHHYILSFLIYVMLKNIPTGTCLSICVHRVVTLIRVKRIHKSHHSLPSIPHPSSPAVYFIPLLQTTCTHCNASIHL